MGRRNHREKVYNIRFGTHNVVKEASVIAFNHKQAERMALAFPNVKSVAKARRDYDRIEAHELTNLTNELMRDIARPTMTPLAMDEFIWMRRKQRRDNSIKDKRND